MRILVQKFGGTSLASREAREMAVSHVEEALANEYKVVVVVSAMGRLGDPYATDTLLAVVESHEKVDPREIDLLMSCGETISAVVLSTHLRERGHQTAVLTGAKAGIVTTDQFSNAEILSINSDTILEHLANDRIVIVTGFQGVTQRGEVTTLGRGGSDTSATALGVALDAEMIDIFTDVDGIMTADPRIVEDATPLGRVTYTEICHLAYHGAKVIHPRAVEIAMQKNIPIRVRSTLSRGVGTLVTSQAELDRFERRAVTDRVLTGVTQKAHVTQIKISAVPQDRWMAANVFGAMADHGISVDFINVSPEGIAYTVSGASETAAIHVIENLGYSPVALSDCAKIAAVGAGMHGVPGVMAKIVLALTEEGIEILQSADSHTTIWCLVKGLDMIRAVRALHTKFGLHRAVWEAQTE